MVRLHPREGSTSAAESLPPPPAADPLASPVARSLLVPLFLGMDDDVVTPSSLPSPLLASAAPSLVGNDYSLASLEIDLYEVDVRRPTVEVMTPERQAAWEAELACSPTPPPMADEVIDAVLDADRPSTPVYRLEVHVRGLAPETQLGTININVMMTPRSGVSVDDDEVDGVGDEIGDVDDNEVDGVGDKVGGINTSVQCVDLMLEVIPGPQWTTAFGSILIRTTNLLWAPSDVR
ncbi:hypothetical protein NDA14_006510 [Ustilago hordei]|nr:hypothetical protein NDA14_006510 [Ustilago hordei]